VIPVSFDKKQAQELVEDIENDLYRLAHVYVDLEKSRKLLEEWDRADDLYYKFVEAASTELHGLYPGAQLVPALRTHHQIVHPEGFELPVQTLTERPRFVATPHRFGLLLLPLHPVQQRRPAELLPRLRHRAIDLPHHRDRVGVDIETQQDYLCQYFLRLAFGVGCLPIHASRHSLQGALTINMAFFSPP
jgi:hypothetical protein